MLHEDEMNADVKEGEAFAEEDPANTADSTASSRP
jgi:hypothetical protein